MSSRYAASSTPSTASSPPHNHPALAAGNVRQASGLHLLKVRYTRAGVTTVTRPMRFVATSEREAVAAARAHIRDELRADVLSVWYLGELSGPGGSTIR